MSEDMLDCSSFGERWGTLLLTSGESMASMFLSNHTLHRMAPTAKNDLAPDASSAEIGKIRATWLERKPSVSVKVKTFRSSCEQGNMAIYWSGVEFKGPTGTSNKWRKRQRFGRRQIQGQEFGEVMGKGLDFPRSQELGLR